MLTRLRIQNFKSWKDTGAMRLAPLTALFGTNSSGKTSILQLLLMLKQTTESSDRKVVLELGDDRSLVELGTFEDVLHGRARGATLGWELNWTLPDMLIVPNSIGGTGNILSDTSLGFSAELESVSNGDGLARAAVRRMAYRFADADFGMRTSDPARAEYELFTSGRGYKFVREQGRAWKLPPPVHAYGFPDQVRAYYKNAGFLSDLELRFEQLFTNVFYLGPLRDYPKRAYTWSGSEPSDMGRRGEKVVDALLASRGRKDKVSYGRGRRSMTVEERVAAWLKELGLIDSFEVRPIGKGGTLFQVWVKRHDGATEALITDVGFGVSQILPVIALCYYVPKGSVVILEQPEIHLHPAVQAGLADVFVDAIKSRGIQLIIESHSEHLLRRLQRRVAEESLAPGDAALYFARMSRGESSVTPLELDEFGTIQNWPDGFFGNELGEIAATQDAAIARQLAAAK